MENYVIALRRDTRDTAPLDWLETLGQIEGLRIKGSPSSHRIQVQASERAIEAAKRKLGDYLHIEKVIPHFPSSSI